MNSQVENMKSELESFLNKGLQDGRDGWPKVVSTNTAEHCSYPAYGEGAEMQGVPDRAEVQSDRFAQSKSR